MSPTVSALVVFAVVLGAAVAGASLARVLPKEHLSGASWSPVAVGIGFIATMAAIVLGLLVASAKSSYDAKNNELQEGAAKVVMLDRTLREYGPETNQARAMLRDTLRSKSSMAWVKAEIARSDPQTSSAYGYEQVGKSVRALSPANDEQRTLQTKALQLVDQIGQSRWLLIAQSTETISLPLLITLVTWFAVIAGCTALFAPRHGTTFVVAALCSLAISVTIFLIMSMYDPFGGGVLTLSDAPLRTALQLVEQP
jgi:hypothetical protein